MWKIKQIFDGDYGCEETQNEKPKVSVTLINENDEEKYVTAEDEWLREKGLDVGDEWPDFPRRLERTVIYESDYVCLYADKVEFPNGYILPKYHQIHYPHEAVCVTIFNEKNEVLLIRNKRYTVGRLEWEIPAGKIEKGESMEDAARRECMEETGCTLKDLQFLCSQNPTNGMSDCVCHCFAAKVDTESAIIDVDEVASKRWVPKEEVLKMLKNNETKDGVSMLGLLYAFTFGAIGDRKNE